MKTRRRERAHAVPLLLCVMLSLGVLLGPGQSALAQERTTGSLTGELTDASGAVLPGVTVAVTNKATGRVMSTLTDGNGRYRVEVDPGPYTVRYELRGFARQETTEVLVESGKTLTLDAALKVGNVSEAVQVTGEQTPLIDVRGTMVSHNMQADEFDRLPKTRSYQSIAMSAPKVNQGEIEGGIQINGASGAENLYTVDGVITNSLINGSFRQATVFEYLQEVQVKTTGISAEYGGALGGVISAVTKSGGNSVHGEGHWYFDGSPLSAAPPNRLILDPVGLMTTKYVQESKPDDYRNEVGGSIGGPIVRDHLWYFGSYSPRFARRTNPYLFSAGTVEGSIKRSQDITQLFGKASYGSRRFNAYGTILYTPTEQTGIPPAYNGFGSNWVNSTLASNESRRTQGYKNDILNTTEAVDVVVGSSGLLTVKGGFFRDKYEDIGVPTTTSWQYIGGPCCPDGVPSSVVRGAETTQNTPPVQINVFDQTQREFINADYSQNFRAGGFHNIKGGVSFSHTVNDVRKAYPGGRIQVFWDQSASLPNGATPRGKYGYYVAEDIGTIGTAGANLIGLYVQDQWQISDRVTLNIGVRTEDEKLPTFRPDILPYAFQFSPKDKLAPRLSVAYDVYGDGRAKLYGAWGRYFDFTKYDLARGSFGGDTWKTFYRAIDDANVTAFQSASIRADGTCDCPGTDIWQVPGSFRDQRIPDFEGLDPDIKPMSQDSFNAGFDYQIGPRSVVGIHYVHNKLNRTIEDIGTLVDGNEVYIYGNPGEGRAVAANISGLTAPFVIPKAKRDYDAVDVTWERRFSNRWFASASYTWSRLSGNYPGLANSDEIRTPASGFSFTSDQLPAGTIARAGGNATRAWDLDELMFDSRGDLDVIGLLPTDRTHVGKLSGAYVLDFGTTLGLMQYVGSGTPLSTVVHTSNRTDPLVNGRGDMGRTPTLSRTDLLIAHDVRMGGRSLRAELNVLNLFNQKTARHRYTWLNRGFGRAGSRLNLSSVDLAKGYDYAARLALTPDGLGPLGYRDPRYDQDDLFSDGLTGQFTLKFIF
ncbi:MAG TPA: TonB-dependent receptor [Vicinamibacterales bacterium]|nr:TonB-dependent receptor [Vicinamibacterales bacterium]